jgi:hypothetical protein
MQRSWWLILGVVLVILIGVWYMRRDNETLAVDLIQQYESAKKAPNADAFAVTDSEIGGVRKSAIQVKQPGTGTRLTWQITVPENGWVKVSLGMLEQSWTVQGDGVWFMISASEGPNFETLYSGVLDPFKNAGDRRWLDVMLDLSSHAGRTISLMLNTRPSAPATPPDPPKADQNGDMPVWGAPRVIVR